MLTGFEWMGTLQTIPTTYARIPPSTHQIGFHRYFVHRMNKPPNKSAYRTAAAMAGAIAGM